MFALLIPYCISLFVSLSLSFTKHTVYITSVEEPEAHTARNGGSSVPTEPDSRAPTTVPAPIPSIDLAMALSKREATTDGALPLTGMVVVTAETADTGDWHPVRTTSPSVGNGGTISGSPTPGRSAAFARKYISHVCVCVWVIRTGSKLLIFCVEIVHTYNHVFRPPQKKRQGDREQEVFLYCNFMHHSNWSKSMQR